MRTAKQKQRHRLSTREPDAHSRTNARPCGTTLGCAVAASARIKTERRQAIGLPDHQETLALRQDALSLKPVEVIVTHWRVRRSGWRSRRG